MLQDWAAPEDAVQAASRPQVSFGTKGKGAVTDGGAEERSLSPMSAEHRLVKAERQMPSTVAAYGQGPDHEDPRRSDSPKSKESRAYARKLGVDADVEHELVDHVTFMRSLPIPTPWKQHVDEKQRIYFHNASTHETTWSHPMQHVHRDLCVAFRSVVCVPERMTAGCVQLEIMRRDIEDELLRWREVEAADGRVYYFHVETRESRWDNPREELCEELTIRSQVLSRFIEFGKLHSPQSVWTNADVEHYSDRRGGSGRFSTPFPETPQKQIALVRSPSQGRSGLAASPQFGASPTQLKKELDFGATPCGAPSSPARLKQELLAGLHDRRSPRLGKKELQIATPSGGNGTGVRSYITPSTRVPSGSNLLDFTKGSAAGPRQAARDPFAEAMEDRFREGAAAVIQDSFRTHREARRRAAQRR
jgi:hypothetical protein